jgi:hypothetical protein
MRRVQACIARRIEKNLLAAGAARVIKLVKRHRSGDTMMFVHPSTRKHGKWQLSWFDFNCVPSGHTDFKDRDTAIRSASGDWVDGPPHGSREYKVVEVR